MFSTSADLMILYSMGYVAADRTSAGVRPEHIQGSPAVAAPSHPPPVLCLIQTFLLPVGTVGEMMAMLMMISHRILQWFGLRGTLKLTSSNLCFISQCFLLCLNHVLKWSKAVNHENIIKIQFWQPRTHCWMAQEKLGVCFHFSCIS